MSHTDFRGARPWSPVAPTPSANVTCNFRAFAGAPEVFLKTRGREPARLEWRTLSQPSELVNPVSSPNRMVNTDVYSSSTDLLLSTNVNRSAATEHTRIPAPYWLESLRGPDGIRSFTVQAELLSPLQNSKGRDLATFSLCLPHLTGSQWLEN